MKIHNYSLNFLLIFFLLLLSLIIESLDSFSTNYTWVGTTSSWSTASNWSPASVPTSTDNISITSTGNSPTLSGSVTVNNLTITGNTLDCHGDTLLVNGAGTYSGGTITNGLLKLRGGTNIFGGTTIDIPVDAIIGSVQFNGSTFNKKVNVEVNTNVPGTSSGNSIFQDSLFIYRSYTGSGVMKLANTTGNTYNSLVTLSNAGTSTIETSTGGRSKFNGNILVECSSSGGISFGAASGGDTLASGKTISIGSNGFTAGTLLMRNFIQLGSTAQTISLSAANMNFITCTFNGAVTFSGTSILLKQNIFNATSSFTHSGSTSASSDGGNVFNTAAYFYNTGTSNSFRLGLTYNDTFNDNVTCTASSGGEVRLAYNDTTTVNKNVTFSGAVNSGYSGTGVLRFAGSNSQTFTVSSHNVYHILMDKTSGNVTMSGAMSILGSLNFIKGNIISTSSNLITMNNGSTTNGANNNSFVSGPIKKVGSAAIIFPVGKNSSYRPLEIGAPSVSNDAFTAEYFDNNQSSGYSRDTSIHYLNSCQYWQLARNNGSSNVTVKLSYDSTSCGIVDSATLRVANWTGTKWKDLGNGGITGNRYVGKIVNSTAVATYGYFTLANNLCFLTANAGTDKSICQGDSVTIGASPLASLGTGPITYSWAPSTALSSTAIANPKASPSITTNYIVTISDSVGCSKNDTLIVTYHANPTVNAGSDVSFCSGDSTSIGGSPSASGGSSPYTYTWSPSTGLSSTTVANPKAHPASLSSFILTVTDNYGCIKKDTVVVTNNTVTYTWTGNTSSDWAIGSNWSPSGVPGVCDNVIMVTGINTASITGYTEVNEFDMRSGTLDALHGLKITDKAKFSGGLINNGYIEINNNDSVLFSGTHLNTILLVTTPQLYLNGSIFDQYIEIYHTGSTGIVSKGGNIFNDIFDISTSETGTLYLASEEKDVFMSDVDLWLGSGKSIYPCYTKNMDVKGNIYIGYSGNAADDSLLVFGKNGGKLIMNGSSAQSLNTYVHASDTIIAIKKCEINKSSGAVTLNARITITDSLNFVNGKIIADSARFITMAANSFCTGSSDSSFVNGPVRKIGNSAFIFPTGKGTSYRPVEISAPSNITDEFTAEYFDEIQSVGFSMDTTLKYIGSCDHWRLLRNQGSSNVTLKLGWNNNTCPLADSSTLHMANWDGTKWKDLGNGGITGNRYVGKITNGSTVASYSYFALANSMCFLSINAGSDKSICAGDSTVIGNMSMVSMATGPRYSWNPATALSDPLLPVPVAKPVSTTNYIVTVTDSGGCSAKDTMIVNYHALPTVNAGADISYCGGDSVVVGGSPTASGGGSPYSYTWTPSTGLSNTDVANPKMKITQSKEYAVTVTDIYGCISTDFTQANVYQAPLVTIDAVTDVSCHDSLDGAVTINVSSGTTPYSYSWNNGNKTSSLSNVSGGTYSVVVTDVNHCTASATTSVHEPDVLSLTVTKNNISCYGGNDGNAVAIVTGGTTPYTYSWTPPGSSSSSVNNLVAGPYSVSVTDVNGCVQNATIHICHPMCSTHSRYAHGGGN